MAIDIVKGKYNKEKNPIGENSKKVLIQQIERILGEIEKVEQDLKANTGENGIMLMNYHNEIRLAKRELAGVRLTLTCFGYDVKGLPGDEED